MTQEIFFGYNSHKELSNILKTHTPQKIFLVTGKESYFSCGAETYIGNIIQKYHYFRFSDFEVNPKLEDIVKGIDLFKKEKCDFVIGIGGGSVMDTAKAISLLVSQDKDAYSLIVSNYDINPRIVPSVMIPTTAGSGAESTHFSVLYMEKTKYSLSHKSILADYVILDPTFTKNLPKYITASTGLDALSQGIESFWSINSTEESRNFSREAIELVTENLAKAVNEPDDKSRINMLKGSNLAGKAINIAKTTAAHAVSYPITSFFNIPHGHAAALTLPYFIEFNYNIDKNNLQDKRGLAFVKNRMNELLNLLKVETPEEARDKIIYLMKNIGIETNLFKLGLDNKDIEIIIKNGFNPQRVKNNPRIVSEEDLRDILNRSIIS